jgi:crotonobetainyl-CoA:carnitine CoA-transferase CaiB-like acyl-CoA transferase
MVEFLNLTGDPRFATITESLRHGDVIDELLGQWVAQRPRNEVVAEFIRRGIPIGPVNSISDLMDDRHLAYRGDFAAHYFDGERTPMLPVLPFRITSEESPAKEAPSLWTGRDLGADNEHVYVDWLGLRQEELVDLADQGAI